MPIPINSSATQHDRPDVTTLRSHDPRSTRVRSYGAGAVSSVHWELAEAELTAEAARPPLLSFVQTPEGLWCVQDVLGAVYGSGPTPEAARDDFFEALDGHLAILRENRHALSPRLVRQLDALEALFPGR